ncbi:MAG: ABC transporter permease subunit [Anaerolineae bacterium]|nr:ABC transporter permease subunit [Anaerolineae bacterium]
MAGNSAFQLVDEHGWRRGLHNLMRAGHNSWWKTKTWWVHALIWTAVINFVLAGILWSGEAITGVDAVSIYCLFAGLFPAVAIVIMMQGAIVGEKQSGTAAWVLSKPVSRVAYILSKLVPNALGMGVTMVLFPAIGAFIQFKLAHIDVALGNFILGWLILVLHLAFFLVFTVMLGAILNSWGAVIGIALGLLFGQQYLIGMAPFLAYVLPWPLVMPVNNSIAGAIAPTLMLGQTPDPFSPVVVVFLATVACVVIAIRKFEDQEL